MTTQTATDIYTQVIEDITARIHSEHRLPTTSVKTVADGCTHALVAKIMESDQDFDLGLIEHQKQLTHRNMEKMLAYYVVNQMAVIARAPSIETKDYILQDYDQISLFISTILYRTYSQVHVESYLVPMHTDDNELPRFVVIFKTERNTMIQLAFVFEPQDVVSETSDS